VLCDETLLTLAGVPMEEAGLDEADEEAVHGTARATPEVMEEFRTFLEGVEPEDFATGPKGTRSAGSPDEPDER
jgi:hypothetical protein